MKKNVIFYGLTIFCIAALISWNMYEIKMVRKLARINFLKMMCNFSEHLNYQHNMATDDLTKEINITIEYLEGSK